MITFTDPRLYVQGIGTAIMTDISTGDIKYFSDKFQDGNITMSADDGIIQAGIGNSPVIMIPSNAQVQVAVTSADYNEYAKSAAVGGTITYGAPVMTCQVVEVTGSETTLTIDVSENTPVAGPGMADVVCYVQEIGAESRVATDGRAYPLNPTSGLVQGYVAVGGKSYLVSYYIAQANASMTTIDSDFKGEVVRFVLQRPIYTNVDPSTNQGDLYGMLYEIIPRLQLMPDGASNSGNQTTPTTTGINGRAMTYDPEIISASCNDCAGVGTPLMYRVIVPCDPESGIEGILGALGGSITLYLGGVRYLTPALIVNGTLSYSVPASEFSYTSASTSIATVAVVGDQVPVNGVQAGSTEITVTYTVGGKTYTDYINVEVLSAP